MLVHCIYAYIAECTWHTPNEVPTSCFSMPLIKAKRGVSGRGVSFRSPLVNWRRAASRWMGQTDLGWWLEWPNISRKWSDNKKLPTQMVFFLKGNSGLGTIYLKPETNKSHLKTDALEDWEFPFGDFHGFPYFQGRTVKLPVHSLSHRIHGTGIFTYPYPYPPYMDPMGMGKKQWMLEVSYVFNEHFFYPKMMASKVGISYSRVPFLGSMLNRNEGTWQFFVTFLGWYWLRDLQIGRQKGTLKFLVLVFFFLDLEHKKPPQKIPCAPSPGATVGRDHRKYGASVAMVRCWLDICLQM